MMNDDELDRALFALPLAEPPPDLRASILASTIFAPRPMMRTWETIVIGVVLAVVAWLVLGVLTSGGPVATLISLKASMLTAIFTNPETLLWLGMGGLIAMILIAIDLRPALRRRS
jgi:hypothetical protein